MLPEYGICMSLVRSTSAALLICNICSSDRSKTGNEEMISDDKDMASKCNDRRCQTAYGKPLTANNVVDIFCYVWYLPLFFAGPLVTFENFHKQVCFC